MDWEKIMPIAIPLLISAGTFALSVLDVRRKGESGMIANYFQLYTAMVGERNKAVEERDKYKDDLEACQEELRKVLTRIADLESPKKGDHGEQVK